MKKIFAVLFLFLMVFAMFGCSGSALGDKDLKPHKIIVTITRSSGIHPDASLYIAAESVSVQSDILVIEGVVSITGVRNGLWVSPQMEIKENKLFISIPKDNPYEIRVIPTPTNK